MKTFSGLLAAALLLGAGNLYAADYTDGNLRKNDNRWLNLNLYDMSNTANAFGPTYDNTYLEVEGGARSGALDLYYFFDINEILGWGMDRKTAGQFFTKVKPRLSIDALTKRDLSVGPVKEWYLATQYKGFNDGEYYAAGIGTDLKVPGVDVLQLCFWPQYVNFTGEDKMNYAGLEVSLNWYTQLAKLPWNSTLSYQGWMDYGFDNKHSTGPGSTRDQFQMFNGFFFNKDHYSLSLDVKFNRHFSYVDSDNSDATTYFAGLHYRL